jgi:hypothetical protein
MTRLDELVWSLMHDAAPLIGEGMAGELLRRLDEPLRLGVTGAPGTGKSTLIDALLGTKLAPPEKPFIWYREGPAPSVSPLMDDGAIVTWPSRALRHMTLVESVSPPLDQVDGLLWLDPTGAVPDSPLHTIAVLSRADEVAGGRIDALVDARRLARRRSREPGSRTTVVAFSGLLAFAGQTLTFELLARLAAMPRAELDAALLSADRCLALPLPTSAMLDLLGLHGLRLATTLIRSGHHTRVRLCEELVRRSGLADLQDRLSYHFLERRDSLKAHSALRGLRSLAADHPPLLMRVEHILANAHEFRELDLLTALRNASISLGSPGDDDDARRLIGVDGTDPAARLGLDHDAGEAEIWELATESVRRWRALAGDASLSAPQRRAAQVVVRSCEGIRSACERRG